MPRAQVPRGEIKPPPPRSWFAVHADWARPIGIAAVVAMTAVNYRGVEKTARLTRVIVAVVLSALLTVGPQVLAEAPAPLAATVEAGRWAAAAPVVSVGAAVAAAGVLLSLLAGVSRTTLSMARRRELPRQLDAVHPTDRTPHRAEITAAVLVSAIVLVADLRGAIGFSSFTVLTYYGLANASAWTLTGTQRRWPRWLAGPGVGYACCSRSH